MTPANVASLQQALLALLTLVLSILVPILVAAAKNWLDAHAKSAQMHAAMDAAHTIARGIEQQYQGAGGAAKKQAAVVALQEACPWLPTGVASVLVEAGVQALDQMTTTSIALEPATLQVAPLPVQRVELTHVVAPAPLPVAEPPALIVPSTSATPVVIAQTGNGVASAVELPAPVATP